MPEFLTILILTPTVVVVAIGLFYAVAMIAMSVAAGVEAVIVTIEHREDHLGRSAHVGNAGHTGHA